MEHRKVEIFIKEQWVAWDFKNLKKGDIFRLFEPSGEPVLRGEIFTCTSDSFLSEKDGVYAVNYNTKGGDNSE